MNPYTEKIVDESTGIEILNQQFLDWQAGADEATRTERNLIKERICFNGFLVRDPKHGHGYLIPDALWPVLFPAEAKR
jgi:hypothetical protein